MWGLHTTPVKLVPKGWDTSFLDEAGKKENIQLYFLYYITLCSVSQSVRVVNCGPKPRCSGPNLQESMLLGISPQMCQICELYLL